MTLPRTLTAALATAMLLTACASDSVPDLTETGVEQPADDQAEDPHDDQTTEDAAEEPTEDAADEEPADEQPVDSDDAGEGDVAAGGGEPAQTEWAEGHDGGESMAVARQEVETAPE